MIKNLILVLSVLNFVACASYQAIPHNDMLYANQSYRISVNGKKKLIQPVQESKIDEPLTYVSKNGQIETLERNQIQSIEQKSYTRGGGARGAYIALSIVSLVLGTVVSILQITR